MPSSYTPNLGLELQDTGENDGTWGMRANAVFEQIEAALAGSFVVNTTGGTTALDMPDGTSVDANARNAVLILSGTLASNAEITVPDSKKSAYYVINNLSMGAYTCTFKTVSGTGVTLAEGTRSILYNDGTNIVSILSVSDALNPVLTQSTLSDARAAFGLGSAAELDAGVANGEVPVMDSTGYPAADGSQITNLDADNIASGTVDSAYLPASSETDEGILRLADATETRARTADDLAVSPENLGLVGTEVLLRTISTASGGTKTELDLPSVRKIKVYISDVSATATAFLTCNASGDNGSTWSDNFLRGNSQSAAFNRHGYIEILNTHLPDSKPFISFLGATGDTAILSGVKVTGGAPINAIRFGLSAGNFDGGTIRVFGVY